MSVRSKTCKPFFGYYDQFSRSDTIGNAQQHPDDAQNKKRMKNDGKKKPDPIRVNARLDGAQASRADKEIHPIEQQQQTH